MKEWINSTIGEICTTVSETYKGSDPEVILINTSDVLEGEILNHKRVENRNLKGQFKKTFHQDDILYSEIRPANKRFAFVDFSDTNIYIASTKLMVLRPRKEKVLPQFLFAFLKSKRVIDELQHLAETRSGTFPQITFDSELAPMSIKLPNFEVQERIVSVLHSIENKVMVNKRINNNLEQQAQALYKAWFIDFEPYSGIMPSNWLNTSLYAIAQISTEVFSPAKNPNTEVEHYSIPAYDEKHFPVFEISNEIKSNKYRLTSNSIMISKLNPDTKRIWRPYCFSDNPVCSTEFIVYEPTKPLYRDFIYSIIDSGNFSAFLCSHTTGSTNSRQRATPSITLNYNIVLPDEATIASFCSIVSPMYNIIEGNTKENQKLAEIRDELLPKLMTGEIGVSGIQV